jgi:hypothetical protein
MVSKVWGMGVMGVKGLLLLTDIVLATRDRFGALAE